MKKVVTIVQKVIVLFVDDDSRAYSVVDVVLPGGMEVGLDRYEFNIDGFGRLVRESGRVMQESDVGKLFGSGKLGNPYASGDEPDPDDPVTLYELAITKGYHYDEGLHCRYE